MVDIFETFEADVIAFDPFQGDFGGTDDRDLSDKMVKAAKPYPECHCCSGPIEKGERHRSKSAVYDGNLMSWRFCWACCVAMAKVWLPFTDWENPPDAEIDERFALRKAA